MLFKEAVFLRQRENLLLQGLAVGQRKLSAGQFQFAPADPLADQLGMWRIGGQFEMPLVMINRRRVIVDLRVVEPAQFVMGGRRARIGIQRLLKFLYRRRKLLLLTKSRPR